MLSTTTYTKIYRVSAWYDLIISAPFALSFTLAIVWGSIMIPLNAWFGFPPVPELDVHAIIFANFFGSVVIVWSVVRLYLNDLRLGVFDGVARLLFSFAMVNALMSGITPLMWALLVPELSFGVLQLLGSPDLMKRQRAA